MPFGEILEHLEAAHVVVAHAGVGSILLAVRHGHVPIVMPRLHRYGEHVDDHQAQLAGRLAQLGRVLVAWDGRELAQLVAAGSAQGVPAMLDSTRLHGAVRAAVRERRPRRLRHRSEGWAA